MAKGIWGIDVSKYSIKAVRLESFRENLTLTDLAIIPYPPTPEGVERNLDEEIREAIRTLKKEYPVGRESVVLSLPSHSTFNRLIKLPPVDDAKIPEVVRYEAQSQIPFNIDEVIWDYQFVQRTYNPGEEKEVILFAIKRDIVEQFLTSLAEFNLAIEAIQFGPVALFNFLIQDQETQAPCVVLDMGADNTDLIVIDGTKFWVRNLPITGNDITKAVEKAFNVPFADAEKLKIKAAQSQQAQKIFNAIQPVLRDVANEVNRSIGYYKSISKISKFEKILLLGNSTRVINFQKFVSQTLQLPAARLQKLNRIQLSGRVDAATLNESLSTIGTALGLALQGAGPTTNRVNLLPPAFLKKKALGKKKPFLVGAAAALYAMVGLMGYQGNVEITQLKNTRDRGKKVLAEADLQREAFDTSKIVEPIEKSLAAIASISSERDLVLKMMDEIHPNIPDNSKWDLPNDQKLWVVDWKFEEKEVVKGVPPAGGRRGLRPLPTDKMLTTTLEVVITKRKSDEDGRSFIIKTLFNYNQQTRKPIDPKKSCVIKTKSWELAEGQGATGFWRVEQDDPELQRPLPKEFVDAAAPDEESPEKNYWRYRITLEIPVGAEKRRAEASSAVAPAAPAPTTEPKKNP